MDKDKELLQQMSPCDTNIYNPAIKTVADAKAIGQNPCPRYQKCKGTRVACTLHFGTDVAKYVVLGSTLEAELNELKGSGLFSDRVFINSLDRQVFEKIKDEEKVLAEIERIAKYLLK